MMNTKNKQVKVGVALVDNKTITVVNKQYLNKETLTDVISFDVQEDFPDGYYFLGDVIVSLDTVKEQAQTYEVTEAEELARVVAHGVLHLLGYDDKTDEDKKEMKSKEDAVVSKIFNK